MTGGALSISIIMPAGWVVNRWTSNVKALLFSEKAGLFHKNLLQMLLYNANKVKYNRRTTPNEPERTMQERGTLHGIVA